MEKLIGKALHEQIESWKKQYGKVFGIKVEDHICYLRTPDRKTLSYATSVGAKDPIKFNEILLNNCWLGGSEDIKTNDSLFLAVCGKLAEIIEVKEAELVNL